MLLAAEKTQGRTHTPPLFTVSSRSACADVHLQARLSAEKVSGTAGTLQAFVTYQYSKELSKQREGWGGGGGGKSNDEARLPQANKKHLVGGYLTAACGRFPGDGVVSFPPNSSSRSCCSGQETGFKVTPFPQDSVSFSLLPGTTRAR